MYIVDFFKRMTRKSNIPVLIYLILNVFVIGWIVGSLLNMEYWKAFLTGIVLYGISLVIALSPLGEWVLRLQTGCKKIKRKDQINRIEPLFREVYEKAKKMDSSIPDDVQLYISGDKDANAFATGRKTICVTEGLLDVSEGQIKATLGHELGHLAHKDTDLILVVSVGNLIITTIVVTIRVIIAIIEFIFGIAFIFVGGRDGLIGSIFTGLCGLLISLFVSGIMWIWTKLGVLLVMKSSRENEYEADEFSFNLGYGNELCALLDNISGSTEKGLFANLASSHPDKDSRIEKLQALGATYSRTYGNN